MATTDLHVRVLLVTAQADDAAIIRAALLDGKSDSFQLDWVTTLAEALARLPQEIDAVLLDPFLPDSQGIATFDKLLAAAPQMPVLLLASGDHEEIGRQAVERGAQDYLLSRHLDAYTLPRALHGMIARSLAEDALFVEKERAQVTLNSIGDAVLCTDIAGDITYLNPVAELLTGWAWDEAVGRPLADVFRIVDGATGEAAPDPVAHAVQQDETVGLINNCVLIRRDGFEATIEDSTAPIHDRAGRIIGAVIVFRDVSVSRAMTRKMAHLAQHDFLTGLPNRLLLHDRLTHAMALARRRGKLIAVLFLDLDRLKHINDSLGHGIGDLLLQSVGHRLMDCVRNSDTVSRQGGDEFVVLLSEIEHAHDAASMAKKMRAALTAAHFIDEHELHVTVSIGISIFPDDGEDIETLIKSADTAMYQAKENGRNNYQFFKQAMNVRAVERQSLEASMRGALARQEFVLHYQPKIDLETGAITGTEALLRWRHPVRGLMLPDHFVPIAEDCGLIVPIGQWVLREACEQAQAWMDSGLGPIPVAVNVSAVEFRGDDFVELLGGILRNTGLEPRYLELELTESVLMQAPESTAAVLHAIKGMGVQLAVDDFGTGYSSLSYLKRFPIDALKIDQSFVQDIRSNTDDAPIVSAVISMGRSLKQRVIAEGVETPAQLAFLRARQCGEGQGHYFSRPVGAPELGRLLEAGIAQPASELRC